MISRSASSPSAEMPPGPLAPFAGASAQLPSALSARLSCGSSHSSFHAPRPRPKSNGCLRSGS
eukprot:scaffold111470_cov31-Tisochrysis_lutea.AAC.5